MKKIIRIIAIITIVLVMPIKLYADETQEEIDEKQIQEDILQVSGEVTKEPQTNSRSVLILDTKSNTVMYEKNGYSKRAMASTTNMISTKKILSNTMKYYKHITKMLQINDIKENY